MGGGFVVVEFHLVIRKVAQQPEVYERIGMAYIVKWDYGDDEHNFQSPFDEHGNIETIILC
jgi:hypothetical protein